MQFRIIYEKVQSISISLKMKTSSVPLQLRTVVNRLPIFWEEVVGRLLLPQLLSGCFRTRQDLPWTLGIGRSLSSSDLPGHWNALCGYEFPFAAVTSYHRWKATQIYYLIVMEVILVKSISWGLKQGICKATLLPETLQGGPMFLDISLPIPVPRLVFISPPTNSDFLTLSYMDSVATLDHLPVS